MLLLPTTNLSTTRRYETIIHETEDHDFIARLIRLKHVRGVAVDQVNYQAPLQERLYS